MAPSTVTPVLDVDLQHNLPLLTGVDHGDDHSLGP